MQLSYCIWSKDWFVIQLQALLMLLRDNNCPASVYYLLLTPTVWTLGAFVYVEERMPRLHVTLFNAVCFQKPVFTLAIFPFPFYNYQQRQHASYPKQKPCVPASLFGTKIDVLCIDVRIMYPAICWTSLSKRAVGFFANTRSDSGCPSAAW